MEIETQKNIVATSESRKKKLTDEIANLKQASDAAAEDLEKSKTENGPKISELNTKIASIDSVIAGIVKERDAVLPGVGKATMRTYELIRKRRKSAKVMSLVTSARTCTVCYKVLEPQLVNEIKRSTRITLCQSCGSILVWTGTKPPAAGQKA
jgi:predicted  nucleic acid-binding Zn-ribbon protein